MFNGDDECCDCTETPPPCNQCEHCKGDQPGDCPGKTCPSFIIEVEGFANTTTAVNATEFGCEATGTLCGAYNGTFILEPTEDPCRFRSNSFLATIPRVTEINVGDIGSPYSVFCYTCEEGEVNWELELFTEQVDPLDLTVWRSYCYIEIWESGNLLARFTTTIKQLSQLDDLSGVLTGPTGEYQPASLCNAEGIAQTVNSEFWPIRLWNHIPIASLPNVWSPNWGVVLQAHQFGGEAFIGRIDPQSGDYFYDECGEVTQFDASPDDEPGGLPGDQFWPVKTPHWICCKDDSWTCDYVRDEIASGNRNGLFTPLFRITSLRCGT